MKSIPHQQLVIQLFFTLLVMCAVPDDIAAADKKTSNRRGVEFFEKRIRPVLVKHCYECHSAKSKEVGGELLLDTRAGSLKGGENGPAVVPKNIQKSLLISAMEYESSEMPPVKQLPDNVIADFKKWVRMGAPDPRKGKIPVAATKKENGNNAEKLWSLKPLAKVEPPEVNDQKWARTDIDRFILAQLEKKNLRPVTDAKPVTLLRRLSFDLVGLPPSTGHLNRVLADPSSKTFETIIDELIALPQFGERWGRHWLDVARYAESVGGSRDVLMPYAWKYRDYVIDAFNADIPYPQFITEQIAGDLLTVKTAEDRKRVKIATGFLAIGQKSLNGGNLPLDIVDDQIDVIGKSVLGLAVSCARCHDHKFDPIPASDYYALAGIFLSTETLYGGNGRKKKKGGKVQNYIILSENTNKTSKEINQTDKQQGLSRKERITKAKQLKKLAKRLPKNWQAQKKRLNLILQAKGTKKRPLTKKERTLLNQINTYEKARAALRKVPKRSKKKKARPGKPVSTGDYAVGVRESKKISNTSIRVRGEKNNNGKVIPRGFLQCVSIDEKEVLDDAGLQKINGSQSGRLQLAAWLTHSQNPLTPRVAANRIWMHLFGRGIVETTDNFGVNSLPPTHPELLDFIAKRFIQNGWSTKKLVREIVMSRTYQLSSNDQDLNGTKDQGNRFFWRQNQRRLEAESIRDAIMVSANTLNLERPKFGSTVAQLGQGEIGRGKLNMKLLDEPFPYRSVYLPIIRGVIPEMLNKFDYPDPSNPQSVRSRTNVPEQSLFFMNSSFVIQQAEKTAKRVIASDDDRNERIQYAYRIILGRSPTESETKRIDEFLNANKADQATVWTTVCQSLFSTAEFRFVN